MLRRSVQKCASPAATRAQRGRAVATLDRLRRSRAVSLSGVRASGRGGAPQVPGGASWCGELAAPQPHWGWLGSQGPAGRALLVAGTSARARAPFDSDSIFTLLFTARVCVTDECKTL